MGDSQRTGALPDLEMDAHLQRPIVRERLCTLLPRGCVADGGVRWRQREGCYEEGEHSAQVVALICVGPNIKRAFKQECMFKKVCLRMFKTVWLRMYVNECSRLYV